VKVGLGMLFVYLPMCLHQAFHQAFVVDRRPQQKTLGTIIDYSLFSLLLHLEMFSSFFSIVNMPNKKFIDDVLLLKKQYNVELIAELPTHVLHEINNEWRMLHSEWMDNQRNLAIVMNTYKKGSKRL
jgi:hypothetical protein